MNLKNLVTLSNQVRCLVCHDTPYSSHRHDYVMCKCGAVGVDGGMSSARVIYTGLHNWEDMSIHISECDFEELKVLLKEPLHNEDADLCCDVYINYMRYEKSAKTNLLPAANWAIATFRNSIGLICAFARTYRDGEFLS